MQIRDAIQQMCSFEYPVSCEKVKEQCDVSFETPNGEVIDLEGVIDCGGSPDVFENEDELFNHIMSRAPKGAIGRKKYDDRGNNHDSGRDKLSL